MENWWTFDDLTKAGPITVHTPIGPKTGENVPHTKQVYVDGKPLSAG